MPIPYSVSPRLIEKSFGGKKRKKRSTFIPTALAAVKWPGLVEDDQYGEPCEGEDPAHAGLGSRPPRARAYAPRNRSR